MTDRKPRADEQAALDAIGEVVEVVHFEWLPEGNERRPDLRLELGDGRIVYVEETLAADQEAQSLRGAAAKMRPLYAEALSWEWKIRIIDHRPGERAQRGRRLKHLLAALEQTLAEIEQSCETPHEMRRLAMRKLDSTPYHPQLAPAGGPMGEWLNNSPRDMGLEEWVNNEYIPRCEYWYPSDIEDLLLHNLLLHNLLPRNVRVDADPAVATDGRGGMHVVARPAEPALMVNGSDYLLPAITDAIVKKTDRDQMAGVDGERRVRCQDQCGLGRGHRDHQDWVHIRSHRHVVHRRR